MNTDHFEIERKYLIRFPETALLENAVSADEIVQTYLISDTPGVSERVRKRGTEGNWVYTSTVKTPVSDMRRVEDEREITEAEYTAALLRADPERSAVRKKRYCIPYDGHVIEIDIFPFWNDRAVMEIELSSETEEFSVPDRISVIRELTSDKRYTNRAIAKSVPFEEI